MQQSFVFVEFDRAGGLGHDPASVVSTPQVRIRAEGFFPVPRRHDLGRRVVVLCGHPIADGRRDDRAVLATLERHQHDLGRCATELDGSFLIFIHDTSRGTLAIINDRFAGIPFHYHCRPQGMSGGTSFRQVLENARAGGGGGIDADQVVVFLWLRRLLGEATLAGDIAYLPAAAVLECDGTVAPHRYWQPNFATPAPTGRRLIDELADGLHQALAQNMSDTDGRFGLLLSGGLDSRALLAAAPRPPVCFTTCLTRNNEFHVAADVARLAGAPHIFIPRPLATLDGKLDEAAALGGMQVYNEAQFLGYGPAIAGHANVVMIGLGLDIFFGGLYLPKYPARLGGRELLNYRLMPLPQDFAGFYLDTVKYRLKTSDPLSVLRDPVARRARDIVRARVEAIAERGRGLGAADYDLWEYMHLHTLSRHYSFPMMASVRTFAECRAPALSNRLFDLAIAMRAADKLDGTPYQAAVKQLAPALMAVRNANTNLPASWSLRRQSLAKGATFVLRRLGIRIEAGRSPGWQDRSWPLPRAQLEASAALMARVKALPDCPALAATDVFDPTKIAEMITEHTEGRHDHSVLLNVLLTLSSALRPTPSPARSP